MRETAQVEELIKSPSTHGVAVIISHHMHQVFRVAHRAFVMRHGQCVGRKVIAETHEEELVGLIAGAIRGEAA